MPASPSATASLTIAAPADELYGIVTDIANMGRLSPECTGGRWLDGATGPVAGARFKGTNRRGWVRWTTTCTVMAAEPGREFTFETPDSGARWSYRFEPDGDGTRVTESREMYMERPKVAAWFSRLLLGGTDAHDQEMNDGLRATLERLKAVAESADRA